MGNEVPRARMAKFQTTTVQSHHYSSQFLSLQLAHPNSELGAAGGKKPDLSPDPIHHILYNPKSEGAQSHPHGLNWGWWDRKT